MSAEVLQQGTSLHITTTVLHSASGGAPRSPSSRRSYKINAMASARLWRISSFVFPSPFAPGISGQ